MQQVRLPVVLAFLGAFVAAAVVGRTTALAGTGLALFWPAAGIAALWILGARDRAEVALDALLLLLATTLVTLGFGLPLGAGLTLGLANLTVGLVVRVVWQRSRGDQRAVLRNSSDLLLLGTAALSAALVSAPIGTFGGYLGSGNISLATVLGWVVRNSCGIFVVAGLALTCCDDAARGTGWRTRLASAGRRTVQVPELVLTGAGSLALAYAVFGPQQLLPLAFMPLALAAYVGFRFGPALAMAHTVVFGTAAVLATMTGWGPFQIVDDPMQKSNVVQLFIAVMAVISLMLSLGVAERYDLLLRVARSEAQARERAELLDAVTDVMSDGLLVIDGASEVVHSNPAAEQLIATGSPRESRIQPPQRHGYFEPDGTPIPPDRTPHRRALAGERVPPTDLLRVDPVTGERRVVQVTGAPLYPSDGDGQHPYAVLNLRDVTVERLQTRDLQAFAGVVAHDLRNPLAAMMSWAEILDEQLDDLDEDTSRARGSLVRIYGSGAQMQGLISDLLAYARAGSTELDLQDVDLDAVVDGLVAELHAPGEEPVVERTPLGRVRADPTLVRQVMANLIGNAVKYVAPGVRPHVRIEASDAGGQREVRVVDNGIGIPEADRSRVFDSFVRVHEHAGYAGTGLGLAICARAVERHHGRIGAEAGDEGRGTAIRFTLPAVPTDDPGPSGTPGGPGLSLVEGSAQGVGDTTSAEPPPRRTGSETAVS